MGFRDLLRDFKNREGVDLDSEQGKNVEETYKTFSEEEREALRYSQQELKDAAPDPNVSEGYSCPADDCNGSVEVVDASASSQSAQTEGEAYDIGSGIHIEDSTSQTNAVGTDVSRPVLTCGNDNCNFHHNDREVRAVRSIHTQKKENNPVERMKKEGFNPDSRSEEDLNIDHAAESSKEEEKQKSKSEQQTHNKKREDQTEAEDRRQSRR